jgi:hypothetical protein
MKDYSQDQIEAHRPRVDALGALDFCLRALYRDRQHVISDTIVKGLDYEQLLGALSLARARALGLRKITELRNIGCRVGLGCEKHNPTALFPRRNVG